jgi:hypothetical protein
MSPPRWGSRERPQGFGGTATSSKVLLGSGTAQAGRPSPTKVPARTERWIVRLRQRRKLGPARIASIVAMAASRVHRVLGRDGLNRLAWWTDPAET